MLSAKLTKKVLKRTLTKTDIDKCKDEDLVHVLKAIISSTSIEGLRHAEKQCIDPDLSQSVKEVGEQFIANATHPQLIILSEIRYKVIKEQSPEYLREILYGCIA